MSVVLATTLEQEFIPGTGGIDFRVSHGRVQLLRKLAGDSVFESCGIVGPVSAIFTNVYAGTIYKFSKFGTDNAEIFVVGA